MCQTNRVQTRTQDFWDITFQKASLFINKAVRTSTLKFWEDNMNTSLSHRMRASQKVICNLYDILLTCVFITAWNSLVLETYNYNGAQVVLPVFLCDMQIKCGIGVKWSYSMQWPNISKPRNSLYVLPVLTFQNCAFTHIAFICFVRISEKKTANFVPYSVHWLVFKTEMESVYYAVRTGPLNKMDNFFFFKVLM